jgi:hypothetical protein
MKWMIALILVSLIVLPAVFAALFVSPWFFLAMLLLMFVPLIFLKPGGTNT